MLNEVKQSLTESDPLPERLKLTIVPIGETKKIRLTDPAEDNRFPAALWWAALAAVLLIAIAPWLFSLRRHADVAEQVRDHNSAQLTQQRSVGPITILAVDSDGELMQLEVDLAGGQVLGVEDRPGAVDLGDARDGVVRLDQPAGVVDDSPLAD
jgi:hypothetical protein